jgi:hypothetical protein
MGQSGNNKTTGRIVALPASSSRFGRRRQSAGGSGTPVSGGILNNSAGPAAGSAITQSLELG